MTWSEPVKNCRLSSVLLVNDAWLELEDSGFKVKGWVLLVEDLSGICVIRLLKMNMIAFLGSFHVCSNGEQLKFAASRVIKTGWRYPRRMMLPIMVFAQEAKEKIRPLLDYWELNDCISSHTVRSLVCAQKLRGLH